MIETNQLFLQKDFSSQPIISTEKAGQSDRDEA